MQTAVLQVPTFPLGKTQFSERLYPYPSYVFPFFCLCPSSLSPPKLCFMLFLLQHEQCSQPPCHVCSELLLFLLYREN